MAPDQLQRFLQTYRSLRNDRNRAIEPLRFPEEQSALIAPDTRIQESSTRLWTALSVM